MTDVKFIHGLADLEAKSQALNGDNYRCVATIGSFDGVHLGHQVLLRSVTETAKSMNLPSLVILFEPQPYEFFSREKAPARLMRLREKVCALYRAGIDQVLCLKFNTELRHLSADEYIQRVLVTGLGVKHLVVGDDFRFGCDRSGDFELLQQAGKQHDFTVSDTNTLVAESERISSTRIRQLLEEDKLCDAKALLGCDFSVSGRVVYGKQLGRTIGFPTVNIGLGRYRSPVRGVYCVRVIRGSDVFDGIANVGVRPTVGGREKPLLEVHLLDVNQQLYGEFLTVTFLHKVREEQTFTSLDALKQQISMDVESARQFFLVKASSS